MVPILSILTLFVVPMYMYWRTGFYVTMCMSPTDKISRATHVLVKGKSGSLDCCKLRDCTKEVSAILPELKDHQSTQHLTKHPYLVSYLI